MSLLDFYYKLASDNPTERIDAAEGLLKGLQGKQNEEDWNYALKRLVRGLSSSRGSARLGFSMALAESSQLRSSQITVKQYLALCDQTFVTSNNMKGNEERGSLLGKLFALQILSKSALWDDVRTTSDDLCQFIERIIQLSLRKPWLREPPFFALVELVKRVRDSPVYTPALEWMYEYIHDQGLAMSCEGVASFLAVKPEQRVDLHHGKAHGWIGSDPMNKENIHTLRRVSREMPVMSGDVGTNKPYIHFVWSSLLNEFCRSTKDKEEDTRSKKKRKVSNSKSSDLKPSERLDLPTFWTQIVDRDFFSSDTSSERKMWGLEIFYSWVQSQELPSVVPSFSENFIKVFCIQSGAKDRNLHRLCKRIASFITDELPANRPAEVVPIISQFMSLSPNFDKTSKSRVVVQLLNQVSTKEDTATLVKVLLDLLESTDDLVRKQWILDNLVTLVRNALANKSTESTEWIGDIFRALIPMAYFVKRKDNESEDEAKNGEDASSANQNSDHDNAADEESATRKVEKDISKVAQDRIMSILSSTLGRHPQGDQSGWPHTVFQLILKFRKDHPEFEPLVEFDEETNKAKLKAEQTLNKIHKKRNSSRHVDSPQLQAFELLFSMVLLQVYGSAGDAVSMLDELLVCYHKISRQRRTQNDEADSEDEEDEDASMVLTEIIVSLMSQQSVVLRKLSEDVWRTFADHLSSGSIALLCDILTAQEGTEGQLSSFDVENDDDDDGENDDDEELMDMDDEMDDEDDVEENDGENDSDDYELDEEAKSKLAGTLGVRSDEDDESEDSMDDEQMSALDVHSSTIFRERRKQQTKAKEARKENRRAKQNIVQLKGRVLDSLDLYVQAQPENLIGLSIIEPSLQFIQTTKEPRLAEKARELSKTRICRKTNYSSSSETEIMTSLDLLKAVQALSASSKSKVSNLACNQVSVFLAKLVIAFDAESISAVASIYSSSLQQWFLNATTNQTTPNLFIDFINFLDTKRKAVKDSDSK